MGFTAGIGHAYGSKGNELAAQKNAFAARQTSSRCFACGRNSSKFKAQLSPDCKTANSQNSQNHEQTSHKNEGNIGKFVFDSSNANSTKDNQENTKR
jgi:hypothetical protein